MRCPKILFLSLKNIYLMSKEKSNQIWIRKNFEVLLIVLISGLSLVVQILDFFGIPPSKYGLNDINYPKYLIVLLSLLAIYLVLRLSSNKEKLRHIDFSDDGDGGVIGKINKILNQTENLSVNTEQLLSENSKQQVKVFKDSSELQTHLALAIQNAQKEICDLTWKRKISTGYNVGKAKKAHTFYDDSISEISKEIKYREIFVFNDIRRFKRFEKRLSENPEGYSCRHYSDHKIPRLQFVIIDDNEVVFFACSENSLLCSIKGNNITKIFKPYFEEIWKYGNKLIEGPKVFESEIDKLKKIFETK